MEAAKNYIGFLDFAKELWSSCCTFYVFEHQISLLLLQYFVYYVAHIRISLSKLQSVLQNQHYKHDKYRDGIHIKIFYC